MTLVSEEVLEEAALQLLASSTTRRYAREAGRLASRSGLVDVLKAREDSRTQALERLRTLLERLRGETERTATEVEAALLLCALAKTRDRSALELVENATRPDAATSPWLRALSFRLRDLGAATEREFKALVSQLAHVLGGAVSISKSLDASDEQDPSAFPRSSAKAA